MSELATITLEVDPYIELGPLTLAWHGLTIALGLMLGVVPARRYARERELDPEVLTTLALLVAFAGMVGARLFYLVEAEPADLARPWRWLSSAGFAFNGALVLAPIAAAAYLRRARLSVRYLDALAIGFPLGMAVGRVGDLINGEHYGPPTALPWGVRLTHPDADVPSPELAYHSGGLYEIVLAVAIFGLLWPLRRGFHRPTMLLWTVLALYASARFLMFFYRSDSAVALGVNASQWASLVLVAVAILGASIARRSKGANPLSTVGGSARGG